MCKTGVTQVLIREISVKRQGVQKVGRKRRFLYLTSKMSVPTRETQVCRSPKPEYVGEFGKMEGDLRVMYEMSVVTTCERRSIVGSELRCTDELRVPTYKMSVPMQ
ncbi:hypothetical protein HAX54_020574, partial [Datura stramonium]|nr:hypothetical protein [Datura stramonium]